MGGILHISSGKTGSLDEYGRLAREIRRLEKQLARLAAPLDANVIKPDRNRTKTHAARILKLRTRRNQIFGNNIFGEPAWDMLLQLYDAQLQARKDYVADLCAGSGVPPSTAFRWIDYLVETDWIERKSESDDRQRHGVTLTPKGRDAMDRFFSQSEFTGGL